MGRRNTSLPKMNQSKKPTIVTQQPTSGLVSTIKQGIATGVGFGVGNVAAQSVLNSMNNDKPLPVNTNPCHKFMELYTKCIENNSTENCAFIFEEFKKCPKI